MYKTKLQEVCHQRRWSLPTYTSSRDGPDHNPKFRASVVVNGVTFDSPEFTKSAKDAQNEAAKAAFHQLTTNQQPTPVQSPSPSGEVSSSTSNVAGNNPRGQEFAGSSGTSHILGYSPSPGGQETPNHGNALDVTDDKEFADVQYIYKNQLQTYAQKRNLNLPLYSCVREGSPHSLRFKAMVTVDGQTFESPMFFRTLKAAEHAAAKAALSSLSNNGIQKDDCGLYKNLLQDLTVKEGFSTPVYTTSTCGEPHAPTFTASVEVEGDVFQGIPTKTKKQAEINAAKIAYLTLKERQSRRVPAGLFTNADAEEVFDCIYPNFVSSLSVDLQNNLNLKDTNVDPEAAPEELLSNGTAKIGHSTSPLKPKTAAEPKNKGSTSLKNISVHLAAPDEISSNGGTAKIGHSKSPLKPENAAELETKGSSTSKKVSEPVPSVLSSRDGSSSPTTVLERSDHAIAEQKTEKPAMLSNRVLVFPRKEGWTLPEGATMLPISDDKWVAVSLDYPS